MEKVVEGRQAKGKEKAKCGDRGRETNESKKAEAARWPKTPGE